jgi:hypothetical protein
MPWSLKAVSYWFAIKKLFSKQPPLVRVPILRIFFLKKFTTQKGCGLPFFLCTDK